MPSTAPAGAEPAPGTAEALRARLAALVAHAPDPRRLHSDDTWLYLQDPDLPPLAHGWKLHISARPDRLPELLDLVVPVLLRHRCDAKFAAGAAVLRELNTGLRSAAAVGKAVTVYSHEGDVVALGGELASALVGWAGPRVVSDRQLRADAPVYYRYGLFQVAEGDSAFTMTGPDGSEFPGLADTGYRQPPWTQDPFASTAASAAVLRPAGTRLGDGRYRITAGIVRSPHGHVYRAVELATGRELVIKQARAFVAEDEHGVDARGRLRHEQRVLTRLAGVAGVPELVDYFRHGEDEYLVSGSCGPRDLRRDVLASGPYDSGDGDGDGDGDGNSNGDSNGDSDSDSEGRGRGRGWQVLARRLLRVLDQVHARGVVVCDLKPANVVLDASGDCRLVDFGVSALDGERPGGATPGYGLPGATGSHPSDDYYALGTTLHYALTGLDPVVIDPDPATSRDRTLACLAGALPDERHPAGVLLAGLLSFDAGERTAAAAVLRGGEAVAGRATVRPPRVTADLLGEVLDHTVGACVQLAGRLVAAETRGAEPRALLSLYDGSAGLGLELLQHADRPDTRAATAALAHWTAGHSALGRLSPALYEGRTGVDLFLAGAADLLGTEPPAFAPRPPADDAQRDQITGLAGIGTGHLLLAERSRAAGRTADAARHLAVAAECARILTAAPPTRPLERPNRSTAALAEGFAHGEAGVAHFLLAVSEAAGGLSAMSDPASDLLAASAPAWDLAARRMVEDLAAATPGIIAAAARPEATRRYGSWCRGLPGIGTLLVQAARHYDDDAFLCLAADAARSGLALAPRMGLVVQCCGLAGLGELLVDLAVATGDEQHWQAAEQVAALILTRSGGPLTRPIFPDGTGAAESAGWAAGTAGVLSFLRRLHRRGGPRLGMALQTRPR